MSGLTWEELRYRLDENAPFNPMRGTPYYQDAVYEQFSPTRSGAAPSSGA